MGWAGYDFSNLVRHLQVTPDSVAQPRFDSLRVGLEPSGHELGTYVAARVRPVERLTAEVGMRYDEISHTEDRDLSPRVLASVDELEVGDGETEYYQAERASQLAAGLEQRLADGIDLRLEAYYRWPSDQHPLFFNARQDHELFPEATGTG